MIRRASWLALAVWLLAPAPAPAQTKGQEETGETVRAPAPAPEAGVETIEVFGERENTADVQDEAQAITAFSAAELERANIVNIDSLALGVPGLHVGQAGQEAIVTLRGIGTENASITGEPGVAFHVDGINFGQPAAARLAFFDFEMLDVKLGPQGLAGGKNSTSGTINVVTKKPTDEYGVEGDLTFGNYDRVRAKGAVNIPFSELAAARVALLYETRDGFLDNRRLSDSRDPFDVDDLGLRAHLRLAPTDTLELLFSYNLYQQDGNGPQADLVPIRRDDVPCDPTDGPEFNAGPSVMPIRARCNFSIVQPRYAYLDPTRRPPVAFTREIREFSPATEDADPRATFVDFTSAQENRFWGWTTTVDWDVPEVPLLGATTLKVLGGFQRSSQKFAQDFDGTDLLLSTNFTNRGAYQYSAEMQWSGTIADRLDWQTGALFLRESGNRSLLQPGLFRVFTNLDPRPLTPGPIVQDLVPRLEIDQDTENKSYGVWLSGTYSASESVRLKLGGRWIKDEKRSYLLRDSLAIANYDPRDRFIGCTGSLDVDIADGVAVPARENPWCSETYRGTMWGAGIDWNPWGNEDHLLFARIDRGHKSGGFRAGGRGTYLPEKNWAYSAGSKSTFLDGRLQLNLDAFFYAYQDMQIVILDEFVQRTENTDARMYGWDLKTTFAPIEGLKLQAILSNLHTETLDYFSLDPADVASWGPGGGPRDADPFDVAQFNERRLQVRYQTENYQPEDLGGVSYADSFDCLTPPPPTPRQGYRCGDTGDFEGLDDYSGNHLSRSPEWKVTVSGEYEIPLGRFGSLTPRVQYAWFDDTYFRAFNREFDLQEAYHQTDAKLIWTSPEDRWDAEVFVTNIEDEAPKLNLFIGARSNGAPPIVWWGPPRFWGVRIGFKY